MVKDKEPRDWNPEDPILRSPLAPHETSAVMRMHRAGWSGPDIMKHLGLRGSKVMHALQKEMTEEQEAADQGRPIHDALIKNKKGKK